MDIALHYFDEYAGDALYSKLHNPFTTLINHSTALKEGLPTSSFNPVVSYLASLPGLDTLPRDSVLRQCLSLYVLTYIGILLLYFSIATASYYYIFDHRMTLHPRFLKNQVRKEIMCSLKAFPMVDLLTLPWFLGDVRGYSQLYDTVAEGPFGAEGGWKPWAYMVLASAMFLFFTDVGIYWIHRWLHTPYLYKRLHKPHHKWIIPTPFASHAFHPIDGYLQSVPYHTACYVFPIHKYLFVGLFFFVNLWSIFIHDSDMLCGHPLEHYFNGPAHHTLHHMFFTCNYGQYFTWADKLGGSFRAPVKGDDPMEAVLAIIAERNLAAGQSVSKSDVLALVEQLEADTVEATSRPESSRSSSCDGASDSGIGSEPSDIGTPFEEKQQLDGLSLSLKKRQ